MIDLKEVSIAWFRSFNPTPEQKATADERLAICEACPEAKVNQLNIIGTDNGEFSTIWRIPGDMLPGEYEMIADDGIRNTSIKFKSALRVLISPMYLKVVWSDTYFDTSLARWKKIADNLLQFFLLEPS